MGLAHAISAIKAHMASRTGWPLVWPNEGFPAPCDHGGKPVDANGTPSGFVEAEIIGGAARTIGIGTVGQRVTVQPGLIRAYLAAPAGTGTDGVNGEADAIAALFHRITLPTAVPEEQVRCLDAGVHGDVFDRASGNVGALVMVSISFEYTFFA